MRILTLVVCFLAAALREAVSASSIHTHGIAENSSASLEYWIGFHDEVAFVACTNQSKSLEHPLLRTIPKAWTLWSRPDEHFYRWANQNFFKGVKMVALLLSGVGEERVCASLPGKALLGTHLTDWVILRVGAAVHQAVNTVRPYELSTSYRSLTALSPKREVHMSLEGATTLFRKRGFPESNEQTRLSAALSGERMVIACTPIRRVVSDSGSLSCYTPSSLGILRALHTYNVTLILKHCKDLDEAFSKVAYGDADILMAFSKQDEQLMKVLADTRPIRYAHETFYSMRKLRSAEVSFFAVLLDSKQGFCILLVAMLVVWLAICVRDYYHIGAFCVDAVLDSAMFLIASFLANSATVPTEGARNHGYSPRLSRAITLTAWMLAILPLSVYFRGELTSRLTVTVPPEQMDTLEKLEQALDKGDVQPCIVRDSCMSAAITGITPYSNQTLQAKLQKAFRLQRQGTANVFNSVERCLDCASKPGFACFTCALEGCGAETTKVNFVESLEPLNVALGTMPATKGYRLARAYDQLLQRLFETALSLSNGKDGHCGTDKKLLWNFLSAEGGEEIAQVFELSAFFATFACLMCLSLFVFFVELALGRHCMC